MKNITEPKSREENSVDIILLIKQFIKFGIVGISNTSISLGIYYILVYLGSNYILANTTGFIVSVINAYYWNNKVVFKKGNLKDVKALLKTFTSYGLTFILSTLLLFIMVNYLHISELIAPVINLIITIPLNFLLNKFWAFK
ncbi:MAG: GtrA family protein [Cellulosilyticum sp.]|nr:GtrA family protein [Cellulosilyticum sp.]